MDVDRATAKARGVNLTDLFGTLQAFLSTLYINDFNLYGRTYRVQAEAQPQFRQTPEDIGRLYVRGPQRSDGPGLVADPHRVPERADPDARASMDSPPRSSPARRSRAGARARC